MNKDNWRETIIIMLAYSVFVSFAFLFIYVVEYQKAEVENEFLREKIEEQKAIIEKMESDK